MNSPAYVKHPRLIAWVNEMVALCKPDQVYWCDGSEEEYQRLCQQLVGKTVHACELQSQQYVAH